MERTTLTIEGMSCGHCVKAVEGALRGVDGARVEQVEVGMARVAHEPSVSPGALAAAVEEEGYRVVDRRSA